MKRTRYVRRWVVMMAGVLLLVISQVNGATSVQSLPADIRTLNGEWPLQGSAHCRKYLINIYDGRLWVAAGRFDLQGLYALDLTYGLAFKAKDPAARSVQELQRIGAVNEDRLTQWGELMRRAFPDIKAGDRLIGVNLPERETQFYLNGKLFSTVSDPAFGSVFFGIWLDPRTSEPDFRRELLKGANT